MSKSIRKSRCYSSSKLKACPVTFIVNRGALQNLGVLFYCTHVSSNTVCSAVFKLMFELLCSGDLKGDGRWKDKALHQTSGEHSLSKDCHAPSICCGHPYNKYLVGND